ncbi:MAG: hypothetical protein A7316_01180 [Candidatus Altiarchaeales archaeon WOR_SM1_86-2]|nr:MAG: hypothetical protein A7315_13435 [Candidatus Altiarchaeales archaeon WOR_SM1_79]ODS38101.1 MAG: hypothetical protein A7316_01180 [Candidatus Altiarchaeales archaeon WOR_SM1_86-2]
MNSRELERLKRCIRISGLRKGKNKDWLNTLEEYDKLRKKNQNQKNFVSKTIKICKANFVY